MIKRLHSNLFLVRDVEKTAEFYKKLGFEVEASKDVARIKPDDFTFAFIDEESARIYNDAGDEPRGLGIYTYVEVDDVDVHYEMIKANGVMPHTEPKSWPHGKREFVVKDPDGYKIVFYKNAQ